MQYCNNCQQHVQPKKEFNMLLFLFLCVCTLVCWCPYLIYYMIKTETCPMCHSVNWGVPPRQQPQQTVQKVNVFQGTTKFCPKCGSSQTGERFCENCGSEINP